MTFKEKWIQDHPGEEFNSSLICPCHFGYEDKHFHDKCLSYDIDCSGCWEREIPEERIYTSKAVLKRSTTIKDSGDRTEFESGAVRDMREGKGRCDLMPLEVLCRMFDRHDGKNGVLDHILHFQRTNSTHHLTKALDRFALDVYKTTETNAYTTMFLEVSKHFEEGAKKYGEHNWQKGMPVNCYIDSAIRHYLKWLRGDKDEPHDRAFVWNLMCCIWEVDYREKK